MKRSLSFVLAAAMPLFLFSWFLPTPANQLDFWLMWLVAMVVLALPVLYAEIALANRSGDTPLSGIQKLTREADAGTVWRGAVWFGALVVLTVSAYLVSWSASGLPPLLNQIGFTGVPSFALAVGLMVIAVILSLLGYLTAVIGLVLAIIGLVLSLTSGITGFALQMTSVSLAEWGRAVMLALVSVGAGSGLYWLANVSGATANSFDNKNKQVATKTVLPIIAVQLLAGFTAMAVASVKTAEASLLVNSITAAGALFFSAALIYLVRQILTSRFGFVVAVIAALVVGASLVVIPAALLLMLLVVLVTISVLMLSIFTGWMMKISHLRKSMNFSSEGFYNLWRIAIRIIVPLAVLAGFVGWIMTWLAA